MRSAPVKSVVMPVKTEMAPHCLSFSVKLPEMPETRFTHDKHSSGNIEGWSADFVLSQRYDVRTRVFDSATATTHQDHVRRNCLDDEISLESLPSACSLALEQNVSDLSRRIVSQCKELIVRL